MVEHSSGQRVGTGVVGKGLIELTDFQVESRHEGSALVRRLLVKPLRIQIKMLLPVVGSRCPLRASKHMWLAMPTPIPNENAYSASPVF